ncbi:MAG: ribonuclease PH [Planctomycetota bacterium]|jgi:ribonuclease PH|nr:ribonuclease PH [Planctomycetota bacterium]
MTEKNAPGRAPDRLRPATIETGVSMHAEGSALIAMGNTRVLCSASVEERIPEWLRGKGRGWVTAEYGMLPRATSSRTRRERDATPSRSLEIGRLIGRCLRAAVDLTLIGERKITVDCDVLQADGGTRAAGVTGGMVALELALLRLRESGAIAKNPVLSRVAAVSVGIVEGRAVLDLDYALDARAEMDMNVAVTAGGELVEVQASAERGAIPRDRFDQLLDLAVRGAKKLSVAQREAIARERRSQ